jgi:hypothetical protein
MATSSTYYLNAPSLGSATAVFTNAALTVCAADGFYSDGVISREQVSCVLLPQQSCPSCSIPCDETVSLDGDQGVYYLNVDLGATTGAVIIQFNPSTIPNGIIALFDSVTYNGLSSPTDGWLQGTAGIPTYIGSSSAACSSGLVAGSPYTLDEFRYNGIVFAPSGTTESVSIASGQLELTATGPGDCIMVIPKIVSSPSILNLTFIGPCIGTEFTVYVACPTALDSFSSSTVNATSVLACADGITELYYVAHVNGSGGTLGLHDLVFSDNNGEFKLAAGYYQTNDAGTNEWYQVDANGVIIAFGDCISYNCVSGNCVDPGDGTGTYSTLVACELACSPYEPCGSSINNNGGRGVYYLDTNLASPTGAIIIKFNPQGLADGVLATYNSINYNGLSSPVWGWLQGSAGLPTYIGDSDCSLVAGSPHPNVAEFEYNGTTFAPLGTNLNVTVLAGQIQITPTAPGLCIMVIPKTTASPSLLELSFFGICSATEFDIDVLCPAPLPSFVSSLNNFDSTTACINAMDEDYYVAHVTGSGGVLGLYDLVFSDVNGQFKLSAGYYKTTAAGANDWYRVDSNGVIIQFGVCP